MKRIVPGSPAAAGPIVIVLAILWSGVVLAQDDSSKPPTDSKSMQHLFDMIDKNRDEHIAFFQELVRTQKGGESAILDLVARRCEELGGEVETVDFYPKDITLGAEFAAEETLRVREGTNLVAKFAGSGGGKSLLLFGHHDEFPLPEKLDWTHDPLAGDVEGNKIIGWGVADDLGGIAIMVEAVNALRQAGLRPGGDLYLCSVVSKSNSRGIVAILNKGYEADAAVYLHPAESGVGLREVQTASAGVLQLRITVAGEEPDVSEPGNEASFAHRGTSAVFKGLLVVQALEALDAERGERVYHKAIDDKVGRSTNLVVGHVSGGSEGGVNRVPTEFTIGVSLTFPPNEKLGDVRKEVEDAIADVARSDAWLTEHPPRIDWLVGTESTEVSKDHPIYQTVSGSIQTVTGVEPFVNPLHSLNDIRNPLLASGIPTVGFGPFSGYGQKDEWVDVEDYLKAIKALAKVIVDWTEEP